jgi:isopentenyl phosphate kinase
LRERGCAVKHKEARVMEMNSKFKKRAKLGSSIVNVLLVLGVLVVLFPLSTPTVKADTIIYGDWEVYGTESYSGETFILYGDLKIHDNGSLTFDSCTLKMASNNPEPG